VLNSHVLTASYSSALGNNAELQNRWLVAQITSHTKANEQAEALLTRIDNFKRSHAMSSTQRLQLSGKLDYDSVS
jgi:hypothetical protein